MVKEADTICTEKYFLGLMILQLIEESVVDSENEEQSPIRTLA